MALRYKHRRDTAANYTSNNPILEDGELAFETDTGKSKLGDGVTAWNSLPYTAGGSSGSGGPAIAERYATWALLLADQAAQESGKVYYATDASGFSTVDSGYAYFEYLGTTNGNESDYRKLTEGESMDLDLSGKADKAMTNDRMEIGEGGVRVEKTASEVRTFLNLDFPNVGTFTGSLLTINKSGAFSDYILSDDLEITFEESGHQEGKVKYVLIISDGTDTLTFIKPSAYNLYLPIDLTNGAVLASGTYVFGFAYFGGSIKVNYYEVSSVPGTSIIVMQDSFTGIVINTTKWDITSSGFVTYTQNDKLIITSDNGAGKLTDWQDQGAKSDLVITTGCVQADLTSLNVLNGPVHFFGLYNDDDNRITIYTVGNTANCGLVIRLGGTNIYTLTNSGVSMDNTFKIEHDADANTVKFFYWDTSGTPQWTQLGTTQSANFGALTFKAWATASAVITTETDTTLTVDNLYLTNSSYSTQFPT